MEKCLQQENFDHTADPASGFRRVQEPLQQARPIGGDHQVGPVRQRLGQEQPGQGDVLEFPEIAEIICRRQVPLVGPAERIGQPSLGDPRPGPVRVDRPYIGEVVADVASLRVVDQDECSVLISFGLS